MENSCHYLPLLTGEALTGDPDQPVPSSGILGSVFPHLTPDAFRSSGPLETNDIRGIQGFLETWNAATSEVRCHAVT